MVAWPEGVLMSAEDYLAWESTQQERHEFWDGEVVLMAGGSKKHNRVCGNCFKLLDGLLANSDCEVYITDVKVQISPRKYFYPDVVVTCDERERDAQMVHILV
jgi:Uma2 family endonuclease